MEVTVDSSVDIVRDRYRVTKLRVFVPLEVKLLCLKSHIPVYSTSLDYGLGTRKPIEWQRLISQVEVQKRDYLSKDKYYLPTIIKLQVYYP